MKTRLAIIISIVAAWLLFVVIIFDIRVQISVPETQTVEYGNNVSYDSSAVLCDRLFGKQLKMLPTSYKVEKDIEDLGTYQVEYTAHCGLWSKKFIQTVNIVDTKPPEIKLVEDDTYYTLPNHKYEEQGFAATDNYDGDLTAKVVRTEANGSVKYMVSDSSGNQTEVIRKIVYNDLEAPEITLNGDAMMTVMKDSEYEELGCIAEDNADGDVTSKVCIKGEVDTSKVGKYDVTYSVTDTWGNEANIVRTVVVSNSDTVLTEAMLDVPDKKVIYLTFDDGPGPYTEELLDVLDKYDVKATFFVTNQYPKYKKLIAEEYKRGHSVAIHSYTHDYATIYKSQKNYFKDLNNMQDIIIDQTGSYTQLVRFPGGSSNTISKNYKKGIMSQLSKSLKKKGFVYFDWNVTSGDAGGTTSTKQVYKNVISGCKSVDKAVVLQHDIKSFSVDAVEDIIKWGKKHGYTFLPLRIDSFDAHHGISN